MKTLTILGRRWFQKTYGNTYHTATILIDGKEVHSTGIHYGYGEQYLETAWAWLEKQGHIPHTTKSPWTACENAGITLHYSATDVTRRKDL